MAGVALTGVPTLLDHLVETLQKARAVPGMEWWRAAQHGAGVSQFGEKISGRQR
jgi:hypothetical protein